MARPINQENVLKITQALMENNASEARGLSVPELEELTGLNRYAIDRIIKRVEYGFRRALNKSSTGAETWYHDVTEMVIGTSESVIQPLVFEDEDKTKVVIQSLMNALLLIDPTNKLVARVGDEILEAERNKNKPRSKHAQKDYFDWFLYPQETDFIAYITEKHPTGKKKGEEAFEQIKEKGPDKYLRGTFDSMVATWWNDESNTIRPEIAEDWEKAYQMILWTGNRFLALAAYFYEQGKKKSD